MERLDIANYFDCYNRGRPRSGMEKITPEQTYWDLMSKLTKAARKELCGVPRLAHAGSAFFARTLTIVDNPALFVKPLQFTYKLGKVVPLYCLKNKKGSPK